jgi:hypothetical protein
MALVTFVHSPKRKVRYKSVLHRAPDDGEWAGLCASSTGSPRTRPLQRLYHPLPGLRPVFYIVEPVPGYLNTGFAAHTRVMSSLQPSFLVKDTWWTAFLCRTSCSVGLVKWTFAQTDQTIRKRAVYLKRKSTKAFEKLKYETEYAYYIFLVALS